MYVYDEHEMLHTSVSFLYCTDTYNILFINKRKALMSSLPQEIYKEWGEQRARKRRISRSSFFFVGYMCRLFIGRHIHNKINYSATHTHPSTLYRHSNVDSPQISSASQIRKFADLQYLLHSYKQTLSKCSNLRIHDFRNHLSLQDADFFLQFAEAKVIQLKTNVARFPLFSL